LATYFIASLENSPVVMKIPFVALFDEDVLLQIRGTIELNSKKMKTSNLILQLYKLGLLEHADLVQVETWKKNIKKKINENSCNFKLSSLIESLKKIKNSKLAKLLEPYKRNSKFSYGECYDKIISNDIYNFVTKKMEGSNYYIKILSPTNFEEFFRQNGFGNILDEARSLFGSNKVLCGRYLAEKMDKDRIPSEIVDIIHVLFSLQ